MPRPAPHTAMTPEDHRHLTHARPPRMRPETFEDTQPGVFREDAPSPLDVCWIEVSEVLQAPSHLARSPWAPLRLERSRDWAHRHAMSVLLSCSAGAVGLLCWATAQLHTHAAESRALSEPSSPSTVSAVSTMLVAVDGQQPPRVR
jgi:hypothetical protein